MSEQSSPVNTPQLVPARLCAHGGQGSTPLSSSTVFHLILLNSYLFNYLCVWYATTQAEVSGQLCGTGSSLLLDMGLEDQTQFFVLVWRLLLPLSHPSSLTLFPETTSQ